MHIYIYTEYYSAIKKNEILPFARWMDLDNIILREGSQTENDRYHMLSLICGICFINRKRLTDIGNKHHYKRGKRRIN